MANKSSDTNTVVKKIEKPLTRLNGLFNDVLDTIAYNTFKTGNKHEKELKKLSGEIDNVVFQEIKSLTSFTGDDISTFLVKLFNDYDNQNGTTFKSIEDIFATDSNGVFQFFHERYKNLNLLYEDLNMICSQLYELQEAISSTRDAIVTADDVSQSVSRTLKFKNKSDEENKQQSYIKAIESMEKKFKLLSKLKNHIVPKTLQYGKYYVYTIPYSKLFERYYANKVKDQKSRATFESVDDNFIAEFKKTFKEQQSNVTIPSTIKTTLNGYLKDIEIYNDEYAIPVVEGIEMTELIESVIDDKDFAKQVEQKLKEAEKSNKRKKADIYADGTVNTKESDFSNIKGCYIKLIDPRKVIPVKILDQVIGYYYIHDTNFEVNKSPFTTSIKINPTNTNANDVETLFLSKITDKIVKAFDKSFLEKNSKFKELIMNALSYNDMYKKQIKFQFIPIDYMTEFSVNEDEEGNGTSVLFKALFYAKLYLALLIFKMISIITKSNDTKIYYVKQSGMDTNVVNKVQEVARSIKEKQINFTDLLNYNSMISKIGGGKEVFMPVGRSGEKGIEFDILAGQDIQLNTDLMEMLRTGFINATGVPSVIMNYVNEADYAKTLVMANAKFVGRVVNHQIDINDGTTELYKKLMRFATEVPVELIEEFEFALAAPKSLNNMNLSDMINNTENNIMFTLKAVTGDNAQQTEDDNKVKDIVFERLARKMLPMLPWQEIDEMLKEAKITVETEKAKTKNDGDEAAS